MFRNFFARCINAKLDAEMVRIQIEKKSRKITSVCLSLIIEEKTLHLDAHEGVIKEPAKFYFSFMTLLHCPNPDLHLSPSYT